MGRGGEEFLGRENREQGQRDPETDRWLARSQVVIVAAVEGEREVEVG